MALGKKLENFQFTHDHPLVSAPFSDAVIVSVSLVDLPLYVDTLHRCATSQRIVVAAKLAIGPWCEKS